jgi:phage/plasmid-like protein (TIGR03299 family)
MPAGASIEEWAIAASLNYTVQSVPLYYRAPCDAVTDSAPRPVARKVSGKVAQVRSDTGDALGIVGDGFNTVQPREVLELFRDWAAAAGVVIETAGALHGGRVYFALAKLGDSVAIDGSADRVAPYIYCSTACDGTRATITTPTAIRVVCANTDRIAMRGLHRAGASALRARGIDKQSHRSTFDASSARAVVESAIEDFRAYMDTARQLAALRVSVERATQWTAELVGPEKTASGRVSTAHARILSLFQGAGMGAQLETAQGTAWGYYNAVTEYADHHVRASSMDNRFDSAQSGPGAALKARAFELVSA